MCVFIYMSFPRGIGMGIFLVINVLLVFSLVLFLAVTRMKKENESKLMIANNAMRRAEDASSFSYVSIKPCQSQNQYARFHHYCVICILCAYISTHSLSLSLSHTHTSSLPYIYIFFFSFQNKFQTTFRAIFNTTVPATHVLAFLYTSAEGAKKCQR
jgi:mannitol-specific phosphotransferase system IIBC component